MNRIGLKQAEMRGSGNLGLSWSVLPTQATPMTKQLAHLNMHNFMFCILVPDYKTSERLGKL